MLKNVLIFLLVVQGCLFSQDVFIKHLQEAKTQLQHGYDTWDINELQKSLAHFNRLFGMERETWLVHYYIGLNHYRLGTMYMEQDDKDKAGQHWDEAIDHLKVCQNLNESFPESYALTASCMGNKISLAPWKAMILGPKSGVEMEKALKYGPDNPRVWLLKGINTNFSPKVFGGGSEKALKELQKAITLFESDTSVNPIYPNWGHDQVYAWIGLIQTKAGNLESARTALEKGLILNPQNGWIQYELIPELQKNEK